MTNHKRRRREYAHAEAFCLMTYRAEDGEEEVVWNSRDGVTPFVITLRSGQLARHVFNLAVRAPDHVPAPGSRMFVDLTPARARVLAGLNGRRWWAADTASCRTSGAWPNVGAFTDALVADYLATEGAPDLVEVTAPAPWTRPAGDRIPGRDA